MIDQNQTLESVKDYYGKVLQGSNDLKTSACCCADAPPPEVRNILDKIHPQVLERFYGCGSPFPPLLDGCTVLDLGCGTGRDVYVFSALVGEHGQVIGVDMTPEQIHIAIEHQQFHTQQFGYQQPNTSFIQGYIEDLSAIADNSVDLAVSNCVINLSPSKERVFTEIFRVLKPGGELYFSDVFADRRMPNELRQDPVLLGECLGGAMYTEDFRRLLAGLGCLDYRTISCTTISLSDPDIVARAGHVGFTSQCIRAFKLTLEDRCEDYGQVAYYNGTIAGHPHAFILDDHHEFFTGKPMLVCGNTADMLTGTRYSAHFTLTGDKSRHFGLFDCSPTPLSSGESCACC